MSSASSGVTEPDLPLLGPAVPNRGDRAPRRAPRRQGVLAPVSATFLRERRQRTGGEELEQLPLAGGLADDQWMEERLPPPEAPDISQDETPSPPEPSPAGTPAEDFFWLGADTDGQAPIAGLEASDAGPDVSDVSEWQEPTVARVEAYGPEREEPSGDFGFPDPAELVADPSGAAEEDRKPDPDDSWLSLIDSEPPTNARAEPATDSDEPLGLVSGADLYSSSSPIGVPAGRGEAPAPQQSEEWAPFADMSAGGTGAGAAATGGDASPTPAPLLQDVAERLEQIARSLRQRAPAEIFSDEHTSDPLEILITGYAIGYSEASRQARDRKRQDRSDQPRGGESGN